MWRMYDVVGWIKVLGGFCPGSEANPPHLLKKEKYFEVKVSRYRDKRLSFDSAQDDVTLKSLCIKLKCIILLITLLVVFLNYTSVALSLPEGKGFHSYWYNYGAEITRFELEQSRYGEIHSGHASFNICYRTISSRHTGKIRFRGIP